MLKITVKPLLKQAVGLVRHDGARNLGQLQDGATASGRHIVNPDAAMVSLVSIHKVREQRWIFSDKFPVVFFPLFIPRLRLEIQVLMTSSNCGRLFR